MTTVYSFTRVEPVSRGGDPGRGLAATVQDPFWMLGRQRQFGELTGEDAGSPVQVAFVQTEARFDGWKPESGAVLPYSPVTDVVEALAAGEAAGPAHSTLDRLQAGRALAAAVSKSVGGKLRAAFPLPVTPDSPRMLVRAATLFADGLAVAAAVAGAADGTDAQLGAALKLPTADATAARDDLDRIRALVRRHLRHRTEQLDSRAARTPLRARRGRRPRARRARPHARTGRLARLRLRRRSRIRWARERPCARTRVPTTIQFPGQPRNRFWEFEEATLALARIDAATTDLGRLALVEFSTIYGNDWFTFPIPVTYGSMQAVSDLVVRDTFGTHELIAPAADPQWAMYRPTGSSIVSPALAVPAVTVAPLAGDVVEEVRFLRDEMANLVWGVEEIITDADGTRRDLVDEYVRAVEPVTPIPRNAAVAYRLMTEVPDHWVPFIPVHLPGGSRQVGLVEAVLPRPNSLGDLETSSPRSSVLQELARAGHPGGRGSNRRRRRAAAMVPRAISRWRTARLGGSVCLRRTRRGRQRSALRRRGSGERVDDDGRPDVPHECGRGRGARTRSTRSPSSTSSPRGRT